MLHLPVPLLRIARRVDGGRHEFLSFTRILTTEYNKPREQRAAFPNSNWPAELVRRAE
jgi:hypothetical protein